MLTRQKSIKSRTRRARRQRSKFVTPDLVLSGGKLMRFVASPDNPLSRAERLRGEYAQMEADREAKERQFLQRVYFVAVQFRQLLGDFERFQAHPFWKQTGQKPRDPSTSKWVLYLIMQATTTHLRRLADKYAVILDGLMQDQVEVGAVAARIQELGGIDAAYEALRVRKRGDAQVSRHGCGCGDGRGRSPNRRPSVEEGSPDWRIPDAAQTSSQATAPAGTPHVPFSSHLCSAKRRSSHPTH